MPLVYDDIPGSWGTQSEGWPETPFSMGKWLLCTQIGVVPYGSYVRVQLRGPDVIRVETDELKRKLEDAYERMFVNCRHLLLKEEFGITDRK